MGEREKGRKPLLMLQVVQVLLVAQEAAKLLNYYISANSVESSPLYVFILCDKCNHFEHVT